MALLQLPDGAWVDHRESFVLDHAALLDALVATLPLRQEHLRIMGREVLTPRLTSWHGDPGCFYRYSGRRFEPAPWTPALAALRQRLVDAQGVAFNAVLVNLYRDGGDTMGAHADDEPELGPAPDDVRVATVSLGARRRFCLVHRRGRERFEWRLGEGDLLVMGGTTQRRWRHHVPREPAVTRPRLSLTFRVVLPVAPAAVE